jgi:polyferredoxin
MIRPGRQSRRVALAGPRARAKIGRWGRRLPTQLLALVTFNSYFFSPVGKRLCIPVLNCYSCPIGTVACPIGSLTAFVLLRRIPFYIMGFLGLVAVTLGRAFCGWACPFGLLQDALYRIRSPKWRLPRAANAVKYVLLIVLVIGLPLILAGGAADTATERITGSSAGARDFCSLVCPAGTLEGGIPYLLIDAEVRAKASWQTWSKVAILLVVLGLMVVSRRSFCRLMCPLGALMALLSRLSLFRLHTDPERCTRCMRCVAVCPTASRSVPSEASGKEANAECVLCLDCVRNCPEADALAARLCGRQVAVGKGRERE